jgi:hypothetical protein
MKLLMPSSKVVKYVDAFDDDTQTERVYANCTDPMCTISTRCRLLVIAMLRKN